LICSTIDTYKVFINWIHILFIYVK